MGEIRKLREEDFKSFVNIVSHAYPAFKINSQEDKQKLEQRFIGIQNNEPTLNFYGLFRDEKLVGGMRLHDFNMNTLGSKVKAGGVGMVAVDLFHKKERVCKDLISYYIEHYRNLGVNMALLYPFRPDFYKRMGFGFGTKMNRYTIKPGSIPRGKSKAHINSIGLEDKELLRECYNTYAKGTHGMIERNETDIRTILNNAANKIIGYKKDGQLLGYMVLEFKLDKQERFLINDIEVKELIYQNNEVLEEFFTFLNSQDDQINNIIFNTQDENFHHLFVNPSNGSNNLIPSVYHESNTSGVGLMYRVINVRGLFENLESHNFGDQDCKLKITLEDTFVEKNSGSTVVEFEGGFPRLSTKDNYEVEIKMDISDFSSLIMGSISFITLHRYGLAQISDDRYINTVNRIFLTPEKPICMTAF